MSMAVREDRDNAVAATPADLERQQHQLVVHHMGLARALARRYRNRGESIDDLEQVALLALVKVARRFDPKRNTKFSSYATVSIIGELKRHFRDKAWGLRAPRSVQEAVMDLRAAEEELQQESGRRPTLEELSGHMGLGPEAVLEALEAGRNYRLTSLDTAAPDEEPPLNSLEATPDDDRDDYDRALDRHCLREFTDKLTATQQLVLRRCFLDDRTQREVGAELGVSQMQVSRILARTLAVLRSRR